MLMDHNQIQGWMPSLYSSVTATSSVSLRPSTYSTDNSQYHSPDQDSYYHYLYNEAPHAPPPRRDLSSSLPESLSPTIKVSEKPDTAVVMPIKLATDEERRAKHREAQRRFVKRKKIKMMQLKQLAVELEKRHDLLQAVSQQEALARDNQALVQQIKLQKNSSSTQMDKYEVKKDRPEIEWKAQTFEW